MQIKRILIILGIVLILLASGFIISSLTSENPEKSCKHFVNLIGSGDDSATYSMFTDAGKSSVSPELWKSRVDSLQPYYKDANIKVSNNQPSSVDDNDVPSKTDRTVTLAMTTKDGTSVTINCFIVKNSSKYNLNGFSSK